MKRFFLLALLPLLLLGLSSCTISAAEYYDHAHLYLGSGDFSTAALMFSQLGEYEDSADFALYCAGLDALKRGDLPLAQADLEQVHPFKSSERYLRLIDAMLLESNGDLEGALSIYNALGSFEDSLERAASLRERIPQRDLAHAQALMSARRWEQALSILEGLDGYGSSAELMVQCRESITREAYDQADAMYQRGQYSEALTAFEALGDVLDAQARVLMCRSEMYRQLEQDYTSVTLTTAGDLMARYAEMEDYLSSADRLQALEERYSTNLALLAKAYERPYVLLGGLVWRVILAEDSHVTLLCQQLFPSTGTDLLPAVFPETEQAILQYDFPRLVLDLEQFSFTQGTGTPADPFL